MKNWLQKKPSKPAAKTGRTLPMTRAEGQVPATGVRPQPKILPPATIVYGVAAGAFFAFTFLLFYGHHWLDGALTFIPGLIFVGFATHLMKHGQPKR